MKKIAALLVFVFAGVILSAQVSPPQTPPDVVIGNGDLEVPPPPPPPPPPGAHAGRAPGDTTKEIVTYAEVMPEFAGPGTFMQYLSRNIKYPVMEKEAGKMGT